MTETTAAMARTLRRDPSRTVREICETLKISEATFYRYTAGAAATLEVSG
jgi:predicted transcriptional regulator